MAQANNQIDFYAVVLKFQGGAIQIRSSIDTISPTKSNSYRIFCRDLGGATADIKIFVLQDRPQNMDKCILHYQHAPGHTINARDLAFILVPPAPSANKASYAIELSVSGDRECQKLGTAYIYLDPKYSTQGTQRMQIVSSQGSKSIGQLQIDYLIIKNPFAYGLSVPLPEWISRAAQLDAGHRGSGSGCRADLPGSITENTVASFNYAARHGADMCELDVMCTSDGIPIVYHNYTLDISKSKASQIDQLTLKELRAMSNIAVHDENCKHNLENSPVKGLDIGSPFPTLEEVLEQVDPVCGLNIELKWPQMLPNGKTEATHYREINDYVDRILSCINEYSKGRHIVLSTLNSDIAIMLRLKQSRYPVLFLTTGDSQRFNDPTTKSVMNAIHFASAFDMAGVNPNAAMLSEDLVRYAHHHGLLVYAWGKIESSQAIRKLRRYGVDGIIYDKIDLIKPQE